MYTLYIDTHSNIVELVLFQNSIVLKKLTDESTNQHNSIIMPLLENLLKECNLTVQDLSDILVVNGPGSFTGVRLGVTIAKTLAYTLNIPIRVMSSILIKAVSNDEKGHHWFIEQEKNGYYVGEFNDLDELLNDYFYISNKDYETFKMNRDVIEEVSLDFVKIYKYSRKIVPINSHNVKPLYVKLIEVQR